MDLILRTAGVIGDRTVGRFSDVKQGSLARPETEFMLSGARSAVRPKNRSEPDDRAFVVARKRGNARGAKGRRKGRSVNDKNSEANSPEVLKGAKQGEEIYGRWPWAERSVWSERMLQTLETGVKGGQMVQNGLTPTLTNSGFLVWKKPGIWPSNLTEKLPFWRAGCGKTASPVRRAGCGLTPHPDPYLSPNAFRGFIALLIRWSIRLDPPSNDFL